MWDWMEGPGEYRLVYNWPYSPIAGYTKSYFPRKLDGIDVITR